MFQSLFYWIFLSEPQPVDPAATSVMGFNPCSIGFSFRSRGFVHLRIGQCQFQSLFYWIFLSERSFYYQHRWPAYVSILVLLDFPFGALIPFCLYRKSRMFQSLFYWIFLSEKYKPGQRPSHSGRLCFNPCSIGFSFRRRPVLFLDLQKPFDSFNPCSIGFSFRRAPRIAAASRVTFRSFNPCSIGFSFRRSESSRTAVHYLLFQSLFYWIFFL